MKVNDNKKVFLSILIVNFNGRHFLGPCLDSIKTNVTVPHEVIVLDNASSDGSVDYLNENYPEVRTLLSSKNLGFAGGNNLAVKSSSGNYLLLLNSDTVICTSVENILMLIDSRPEVGVVGCRLFYGNKQGQASVGSIPDVFSLLISWTPIVYFLPLASRLRRTTHSDCGLYNQKFEEVGWVSGAFLLTRTELWEQAGGLDEKYFMYMEDTDYCRRVRDMGYKVVYSNLCEVIHYEGGGRTWLGKNAIFNTVRSYLIYVEKFYGAKAVLVFRIFLSIVFLVRAVGYLLLGLLNYDNNGFEKFNAYGSVGFDLIFKLCVKAL